MPIVDASRAHRDLLKIIMKSRPRLNQSRNGEQAIALVSTEQVDLLLLDVIRTVMEGYLTGQLLRQHGNLNLKEQL